MDFQLPLHSKSTRTLTIELVTDDDNRWPVKLLNWCLKNLILHQFSEWPMYIHTHLMNYGGLGWQVLHIPTRRCLVSVLRSMWRDLELGARLRLGRSRREWGGGVSTSPCRGYLQTGHLCPQGMDTVHSWGCHYRILNHKEKMNTKVQTVGVLSLQNVHIHCDWS